MQSVGSVKNSFIMDESAFFNDKDIIPTDLPILNIAFSGDVDGGLISGLTLIAGESKSFKTLLSLYCLAAYFKKYPDSICLFYDSEFGVTPQYLKQFGIDPSRIIHIPIEHIEQLKFDIVKRLEQITRKDKVFIFLDSLGNLASKKEVEDATDEKSVADMTRAKSIKSLFRIVTPHLTMKDIPMVAVNHIYKEQGLFPKNIVSGGCIVKGTKIRTPIGLKNVEDFVPGDLVDTLEGYKKVTYTWNPETLENGTPECYQIEFEDGLIVECSDSHLFLVNNKWVKASDLNVNTEVTVI